jgi:hypothetical protein
MEETSPLAAKSSDFHGNEQVTPAATCTLWTSRLGQTVNLLAIAVHKAR